MYSNLRNAPQNKYVYTQAHIFDVEISAKTAILAGFRAPDKIFSKMMPKHKQWDPRAILTSFGIQSVGTNNITPQNKYLHTQAQKFDDEVSAKKAILAIFKGWNADFSKMTLKLARRVPGGFYEHLGM